MGMAYCAQGEIDASRQTTVWMFADEDHTLFRVTPPQAPGVADNGVVHRDATE